MLFNDLPFQGRIFFKTSAGVVITSAPAYWGPLLSTYSGVEVPSGEVKNTSLFVCPGFTQKRLAARIVDQGHLIWVSAVESYLITGLKDHGMHTEFVGLKQALTQAFVKSSAVGLISEWAFKSSAALTTDEKALNALTNVNGVAFSSDKPLQVPFDIGSAVFVAASSQRLEIADGSQLQLDITGSYTIAFRFKLTSLPGVGVVYGFVCKAAGAGSRGYYAYVSNTRKLEMELSSDGTSQQQCTGGTLLSVGTWYSYASVYNGTDVRNYLNGSLDSNGAANPAVYSSGIFDNSQKFCMGCRSDNSQFLDGQLAHVLICNQSKTAQQIMDWHSTDVLT